MVIVVNPDDGVSAWTNAHYKSSCNAMVFGAFLDGNWIHGEGRYGGASGPNRHMSIPPELNDPDHIDPQISGDLVGLRPSVSDAKPSGAPGGNDYGGVHSNSGIPNKVAYLVTEGGVHNGLVVGGIGDVKAARLYYSVLAYKLHKKSDFQHARDEFVPLHGNPRQIDNDGNGTGMWCDGGEPLMLIGFGEQAISFEDQNPLEPVRFEIFPCGPGTTCPDTLPEIFEVQVDVEMIPAYQVRVVDDRGYEMADAEFDEAGSYSMSFVADHEYYYDAGGLTQPFQGRWYFLEMLAPPGASPAAVTGTIDVNAMEVTP